MKWKVLALLGALCTVSVQAQIDIQFPDSRGYTTQAGKIDTRVGDPISKFRIGGDRFKPENPSLAKTGKPTLPPSTIVPGGVTGEQRSFAGTRFPGIVQDAWRPSDCTIAVGPNHIVETTNMKIAFYTKSGAQQYLRWLGNQEPQGFFVPVGAGGFTFDPKCLYDARSGRFIVVVLETDFANNSFVDIAVSDDSDPNGTWYLYKTDSKKILPGGAYWVDYPGLGVDQNAVYITGNLFRLGDNSWGGAFFRCFPLAPLLTGSPTTFTDFVDTSVGSVQAAQMATNATSPNTAYFASDMNSATIRLQAIRNVITSPTLHSFDVAVPPFSYAFSGAPQLGTGSTIDSLDGRLMNVYFRNGRLVTSHAVSAGGSGTRSAGRWYEFDMSSWPTSGSPNLVQAGNVTNATQWMLFPVVALNEFMDMGLLTGASSSLEYPGVYSTGRKKADAAGNVGALAPAKVGLSGYNGGRWGDYFGIQVDPADGLTFWGVGMYADSADVWRTWITSWTPQVYRHANISAQTVGGTSLNLVFKTTVDGRGLSDGTTPMLRSYADRTLIFVKAPDTAGAYTFDHWEVTGPNSGTTKSMLKLPMTSDRTIKAIYR
ncbi:MAG TPA: hypothetical protein PLH94_13015 [Fimbriimonadaceae bacterium]|nr:hypothetical protein [Fimbriimonadaceae bacterium]